MRLNGSVNTHFLAAGFARLRAAGYLQRQASQIPFFHSEEIMNRAFLAFAAASALGGGLPVAAQVADGGADAVVEAWASAFNECSAEKLSALYDPAATLWGTNSSSLITAAEGVRSYFKGACAMQPPAKVTVGERTTRTFGVSASSAGTYTFVRDGRSFPARYSFMLVRAGDRWLIVQHHSSLLPARP